MQKAIILFNLCNLRYRACNTVVSGSSPIYSRSLVYTYVNLFNK